MDSGPNNCSAGVTVALVESNSRPMDVALVNAQRTNKMNDCTDIVELAKSIQKADEFVRATAGSKLNVIAEQIRHLQEQAKKVLTEASRDADLHHVACNLIKKPGTTYHLYRRRGPSSSSSSGQKYLSLLSPQEWGSSCPHEFLGSYHLELDMSWTPLEEMKRRMEENAVIDNILKANPFAITN